MPSPGLPRQIAAVVRRAFQARLADCHFALPGKVKSYDATANLADVEIMVKHPLFNDDGGALDPEDLGVLASVPVKWPRAGGFYMSFPLQAGDEGELVFHSTPIGEWRASGQKGDPDDASRFSIGYPTFRADLFNDSRTLPDVSARGAGIVIGKEGSSEQILIQSGLIQAGASGAQALATKADIDALIAALVTFAGGTVSSFGTVLSTSATFISAVQTGAAKPVYTTLLKGK